MIRSFIRAILCGALLAAPPAQAGEAHANPTALAAYKEGMRLLNAEAGVPDKAITLLMKAASLGLPHAEYGLACAMYRSSSPRHEVKAFRHAQRAAKHKVVEAKVLLMSYYANGYGTSRDLAKSQTIQWELYHTMSHGPFPLVSGAPGTETFTQQEIILYVHDTHKYGICCPPIPDNPDPQPPSFELLYDSAMSASK
jgi:TPR repeat protein